jgi:hypothetical protein
MKTCPCCKIEKEPYQFNNNRRRKDGLSDWCKLCNAAERSRRYATKEGRASKNKSVIEFTKRNYLKNIDKHRARDAVKYALRTGRLTRPDSCGTCGSDCKPQGHHVDYEAQLDVQWLCAPCHTNAHHVPDFYEEHY